MNKTLYVADEDRWIWDRAKQVLGERQLSQAITDYLRSVVEADEERRRKDSAGMCGGIA